MTTEKKRTETPLYLRLTCEDWLKTFKQLNKTELGVLYYIRTLDPSGDREIEIDFGCVSGTLGIHRTSVSRAIESLVTKKLLSAKYAKEGKPSLEKLVTKRLKAEIGGLMEVVTPSGRIDLLTDTEVIEVKHAKDWKAAMGQVIAYSGYFPTHQKRLHLFHGKDKPLNESWEAKRICSELGIAVTIEEIENAQD
jgi:predicted transcriptional regulator